MNLSIRSILAGAAVALIGLGGLAQAEEPTVLAPVSLQQQAKAVQLTQEKSLVSGTYRMEDGRDLQVSGQGLRVRLGDDPAVSLVASPQGGWHSPDGEMQARFSGEAWGRAESVVLTLPRRNQTLASVSRY
jgi:hypothetical protein